MPVITIDKSGCRACNLCVEVCPTEVLKMDDAGDLALVAKLDDCIGCTSCVYVCPSRCIAVTDFVEQRPFHRIDHNIALIERFIQAKAASAMLTDEDYDEALKDVFVRLHAISEAVVETMGRGQKTVGRKAGQLAASHLPELYEGVDLEGVLSRMQERFRGSFDFEGKIGTNSDFIDIKFNKCALMDVVQAQGQKPGQAVLCQLFHEYWAGLWSTFASKRFTVTPSETGHACTFSLVSH